MKLNYFSCLAKNLDVAARLQTHPSLLNRTYNRPKLEDLKKMDLAAMFDEDNEEVHCF